MHSIHIPYDDRDPGRADSNDPPGEYWAAVKPAAEAALPDFLLRQRWYPAKDAGRPEGRIAYLVPFQCPEIEAAVAVWQVSPPRAAPLFMFVPVAFVPVDESSPDQTIANPDAGSPQYALVEAFSDDRFVRAWIELQLRSGTDQFGQMICAGRTAHNMQIDAQRVAIHRSGLEQSNTSLRIGDQAFLKVVRKLETGAHPEIEIGRFLERAGFSATPRLLGWVELAWQNERENCALSLLQEFVPNQGDGWSWTLDQLARETGPGELNARAEILSWLQALARRTAELHRVFARHSADPSFQPEPVTPNDLDDWVTSALVTAERALDRIAAHRPLDRQQRQSAAELAGRRVLLQAQLRRLRTLQTRFLKTRHHGDFHLGQVLVAGKDAVIIDFEGEPLKPLAERRAKHCVLRDVAGVLRSLSYAAETAARRLPVGMPPDKIRGAVAALQQWRSDASRVFVDSYFAAAQHLSSIPPSRPEAEQLLKFFLLEKALYEITYELANRPDWVSIPLRGVVSILRETGAADG